jgi:predicted chitinase/FMN phosphatase YigB (HAD superfamily)
MRASEIQPKKLVVFDIDDTLVHTQTKVHVVKDGTVVKSLNSHDFTHYKLQPGESFDFEDFRNAKDFFEKSKPIIPMMNQLKRDISTGNKVVMVTARADFDDKELFLDTFRKYGVDIDKVHVYRAGNSKQGTTEERKKQIIDSLLNKDNYTKAIMYDDAKPNLHTFIELKKDHPNTRFYAWHVSLDGDASEYMREGIVAEKKKRKRKPRWAAYGPGPFGGYGYAVGYSGDSGGAVGEGWKDTLAGAALATGMAFGAPGDADAKSQPIQKPSVTQQVTKKELSKTVTGNPHEVVLKKVAEKAGIKGHELAAFLAQCAHETLDFKHMKEIGGSLDFKKYDIRFSPKKAKALGNLKPGDGAKYKGRGYIQLTGKYNYKKAGDALGFDLVNKPELVEKPEIAAKVAVWYWQNRVQPKVDNFKDVKDVTKPINPGLKHLDQRQEKHDKFMVAMK